MRSDPNTSSGDASRDLRRGWGQRSLALASSIALASTLIAVAASRMASATAPAEATPAPAKPKPQANPAPAPAAAAKAKPPVLAKPKVAVFAFVGDSGPVRDEVVRLLRARRLTVITSLRPVDRAEQFREMATALGLSAYVDGEINDDGKRETAIVHLRSAITGLRIASARFSGDDRTLSASVRNRFWNQLGAPLTRACAGAARPRRLEHPMRIEAGTPIEDSTTEVQEGT